MKLLFKQRFFTLLDNFDIYNERGDRVYVVEGQLSLTHCLKIYDVNDCHMGTVKQRFFSFLPKFDLYIQEQCVGSIQKELTLFHPRYYIDYNGWHIEGNWLEWDYSILDRNGQQIAQISKELLNWTDTYSITVHNPADALCALMVVLAIDAEKCSRSD